MLPIEVDRPPIVASDPQFAPQYPVIDVNNGKAPGAEGGFQLAPEIADTNAPRMKGFSPFRIQRELDRGRMTIDAKGKLQWSNSGGEADALDNSHDYSEPRDNPNAELRYAQGATYYFRRGDISAVTASHRHDNLCVTLESGQVYVLDRHTFANREPVARFGDDSRIYDAQLSVDGNALYTVQGEWVGEDNDLHYEVRALHKFSADGEDKKSIDLPNPTHARVIRPLSNGTIAMLDIEPYKNGEANGTTRLTILDANLREIATTSFANPRAAAFYQDIWEVDSRLLLTAVDSARVFPMSMQSGETAQYEVAWDGPGDMEILEEEGLMVEAIPGLQLDPTDRSDGWLKVSDIRPLLDGKSHIQLTQFIRFPGYNGLRGPWFYNLGNGMIAAAIDESIVQNPDGTYKWRGGIGAVKIGRTDDSTYPLSVLGERLDDMDVDNVGRGGVVQYGSRVVSSIRSVDSGESHRVFMPSTFNHRGSGAITNDRQRIPFTPGSVPQRQIHRTQSR